MFSIGRKTFCAWQKRFLREFTIKKGNMTVRSPDDHCQFGPKPVFKICLLMRSCHKTILNEKIHLRVKLKVVYRWQHSTGIKRPDVRWHAIYKDTAEQAWGSHAHPVVCEDPLFIYVQAWVYVFTSSDVCYLVPCSLFLFPSTGSFFIVLPPFPPYFSFLFLLSFVIQFELVPKVCEVSQKAW